MSTAADLIEHAFSRLAQTPGFSRREGQVQLSQLIGDLIEGRQTGAFEAPTGLGKSLATLIPAIAHALAGKTRTVIATYTNVLAEQYWRKDLPFALSLFDDAPDCRFLVGRQRYACLVAMDEHAPELVDGFRRRANLGIESEFREVGGLHRGAGEMWREIAVPPVCSGRFCPLYHDCFYYRARRQAEKAQVVITNHSVVLMDALMATASEESQTSLGKYDYLIIDEAHDFVSAAASTLEFELSATKLEGLLGLSGRLDMILQGPLEAAGLLRDWRAALVGFRQSLERAQKDLRAMGSLLGQPGILSVTPPDLWENPTVKNAKTQAPEDDARTIATAVMRACSELAKAALELAVQTTEGTKLTETINQYGMVLREYAIGCGGLFEPQGVAVTHASLAMSEGMVRKDTVDFAEPLRHLLWDRVPTTFLSATLAIDQQFEFFRRTTGANPHYEEILPSPFDHVSQACLYVPPARAIPDPTVARREGTEEVYFDAIARELQSLIELLGGRTLALFHSRREMEAVAGRMRLPAELPLLVQGRSGAGNLGERFRREKRASLFGLRSFWTGFDAPGETLSCVALVRIPFEVPVEPAQIVRMAWLSSMGLQPFAEHSLPMAKMAMRQGAGRLIRRREDQGVIAILDPRVRTKNYGEQILANMPEGMRSFEDLADALGYLGIEPWSSA